MSCRLLLVLRSFQLNGLNVNLQGYLLQTPEDELPEILAL